MLQLLPPTVLRFHGTIEQPPLLTPSVHKNGASSTGHDPSLHCSFVHTGHIALSCFDGRTGDGAGAATGSFGNAIGVVSGRVA